jgi:hypothetical protein
MPAQERPTAKQQSYLRSLAKRTGTTFTPPKTKRDASAEIKRLKGLQRSAGHERAGDRDAVQAAPRGGAARVRHHEIEAHGSTATWGVGRASGQGS